MSVFCSPLFLVHNMSLRSICSVNGGGRSRKPLWNRKGKGTLGKVPCLVWLWSRAQQWNGGWMKREMGARRGKDFAFSLRSLALGRGWEWWQVLRWVMTGKLIVEWIRGKRRWTRNCFSWEVAGLCAVDGGIEITDNKRRKAGQQRR